MLHISRCALARQTYWYHSHVCVSIHSKVIDKMRKYGAMCPLERSSEVTIVVFGNNFSDRTFRIDRIEIKTRGLYLCLFRQGASADICSMTYMNQHMTLTWDDLRLNFKIALSRSLSICFEPARRAKHIDVKIMVLTLMLEDLFTKSYFHIKRYFDLWWPPRTLNTDLTRAPLGGGHFESPSLSFSCDIF